MLQDITTQTPHACTKYIEKERPERKCGVVHLIEIETKGKSFAHHTSAVLSSGIAPVSGRVMRCSKCHGSGRVMTREIRVTRGS